MGVLKSSVGPWVATQTKFSRHPESFWQQVAAAVMSGRTEARRPRDRTLGSYGYTDDDSINLLVDRNMTGMDLEEAGDLEEAVMQYEVSVADGFDGTHPYDRLRITYTRRLWFEDAIRVCQAYLDLPKRPVGQDKRHFQRHLASLNEKLKRRKEKARGSL